MSAATIKDLLSYRVHRLANALSRGAATRYRREFDVSLMEWRTLALLGGFSPMPLKGLSRQSGLDKAQASRTVSALVTRGLVLREVGREDAREVTLRLSPAGEVLYDGLMRAARARDELFLGALAPEERRVLEGAIARLTELARSQS
ncbi:MarR family transcriptional regulator [Humitalea rosea]|uniref:MarR family transcriptional regulator n=1 Tax=Humitalea rosea TaxID=990373 RepID=A0A2W7INP2_9PROT|nr:MarR family transcriptional regulator [Humitalea rosea]PZW48674.1 MarR family transcriptional regulator [Humitalea rosea]